MNFLLGYMNPAIVALVFILGPLMEHGAPNSPIGWGIFLIVAIFALVGVGIVWYFTWIRPPALKTESWLDRH